jgi:hypothetical protein
LTRSGLKLRAGGRHGADTAGGAGANNEGARGDIASNGQKHRTVDNFPDSLNNTVVTPQFCRSTKWAAGPAGLADMLKINFDLSEWCDSK